MDRCLDTSAPRFALNGPSLMHENPYKSPEAEEERRVISASARRFLWIGTGLLLSGIGLVACVVLSEFFDYEAAHRWDNELLGVYVLGLTLAPSGALLIAGTSVYLVAKRMTRALRRTRKPAALPGQ